MSNLTACERLELIRHKDRPTVNDYIPAMFTRFMEFHGDRLFGDDAAIARRSVLRSRRRSSTVR